MCLAGSNSAARGEEKSVEDDVVLVLVADGVDDQRDQAWLRGSKNEAGKKVSSSSSLSVASATGSGWIGAGGVDVSWWQGVGQEVRLGERERLAWSRW